MNPELEKLIDFALADGVLTDKEKEILFRKAKDWGVDIDEFEMVLEGRTHQLKQQENKKENITKCPSCGETISGLSQVCALCGYVLNQSSIKGENTKNLPDAIHKLEELIIEVKTSPKPSFFERLKVIVLTYFSLGMYLIYRRFIKKQGESFDKLVAKCDKEKRYINTYYGAKIK